MIVLYYEMYQGRKTPVYYRHTKNPYLKNDIGPLGLGYRSTRIWEWDSKTDSARCIKNRFDGVSETTSVDPREFLMIQLAAQDYKNETA